MAYTLPNFNLDLGGWRLGHTKPDPYDVTCKCQLWVSGNRALDITPHTYGAWDPSIFLRIPMGAFTPLLGDTYQLAGDQYLGGRYDFRWWERVHKGFLNEYWLILVEHHSFPLDFTP